MKVGDKVRVLEPYNGFSCDIEGVITSFYEDDRVIVKTGTGNAWALKKSEIKVIGAFSEKR